MAPGQLVPPLRFLYSTGGVVGAECRNVVGWVVGFLRASVGKKVTYHKSHFGKVEVRPSTKSGEKHLREVRKR